MTRSHSFWAVPRSPSTSACFARSKLARASVESAVEIFVPRAATGTVNARSRTRAIGDVRCTTESISIFETSCSRLPPRTDCPFLHGGRLRRGLLDSLAFDDRHDPVDRWNGELLDRAVRPVHFEPVDLRRLAEAEVKPSIALRRIARAAHFVQSLPEL